MTNDELPFHSSFVIREFVIPSYFFFSVCSVCLRSRGLYFFSFSFSAPDLPPQRVVMIAALLAYEEHGLLTFSCAYHQP